MGACPRHPPPGIASAPRNGPPGPAPALLDLLRARAWRAVLLFGAALALAGAGARPLGAAPAATEVRSAAPALPRQQVLRRTLRADPTQQYLLYVPGRGGEGAPILVATHGISRNVEEHAALFAPFAEKRGVVLVAPYFPGGEFADYQRLGADGRGRRADLALDAILAEVRSLTGAAAGPFYLFGFSGGAQFAHRYVLAHPDRVAAAGIGAAGWYTFPDSATPYPYGLGRGAGGELEDVRFEPARFLRVPMTVFVGTADTGTTNVRRNAAVDRQQGPTRLERARRWTAAMQGAARARGLTPLVTCEAVPGIGHSFAQFMREGGLGDRVCAALFVAPRPAAPRTSALVPAGAGP